MTNMTRFVTSHFSLNSAAELGEAVRAKSPLTLSRSIHGTVQVIYLCRQTHYPRYQHDALPARKVFHAR